MSISELSKNDWVMPFLGFYRSVREKLQMSVANDHPVLLVLVGGVYKPPKLVTGFCPQGPRMAAPHGAFNAAIGGPSAPPFKVSCGAAI